MSSYREKVAAALQAMSDLLTSDPTTVAAGNTENLDVRGFAEITLEFGAGATGCDFSFVGASDASAHGWNDDGTDGPTNVTATTTQITVRGPFLRVNPTGGPVTVHGLV